MSMGMNQADAAAAAAGRKLKTARNLLCTSSLVLVLAASAAFAQSYRFSRIDIEGNQRIGDPAILTRAGITPGTTVTAGEVNDALQSLRSSGLFETVEVEPRGSTLLITVREFPTINRISFEGNRRLDDDTLAPLIRSEERRVFNPAQAARDADEIAGAYSVQGRIAARVTPQIIRRSDNRVDLIFEVFEGDVVEIERISFVGNRVYSDRRLRRVLETKQAGFFRTFIRSDTLVEDRLEFDKQVLSDFYNSRGYVDFRTLATNAELTEERDGFFLTFNVEEGQQFRFGEVTVVSELSEIDSEEYQDVLKIRPGIVYSPLLVDAEIARLERQAQRDGVDFLRVEPRVTRNDRDLTLDVDFVLTRGPRVFVERIDIEGNTTTLDRVIRRQFKIAEGDPFNPREIRDAAERIRALDYFNAADVNAREGSSPDQVIVDVDLEEKPTGSLSFGGSYSANDGIGLALNFTERNFLGRGQTVGFNFSSAAESERYGFNFVEPAFLGRDVRFAFRAQYSEADSSFANYDSETLVVTPSLTFPVAENARLQLRADFRQDEMISRDPVAHGAVVAREIDSGKRDSFSLGYTYFYDTRSSGLNPNAGVLLEFGQDFSGLGTEQEFIRTRAKISGQRTIFNEDVTLRATVEGGLLSWNGGTNRTVDRFLTNTSIIRGFEPGGIGPRDLSAPGDSDPLGGNIYVAARLEAEFPLGLPGELGITGGVFYDVGNVWDLSDVDLSGGNIVGEDGAWRQVVGVSLFWDTAIGPLRLNFSQALNKETYDKEQSFDFTISASF